MSEWLDLMALFPFIVSCPYMKVCGEGGQGVRETETKSKKRQRQTGTERALVQYVYPRMSTANFHFKLEVNNEWLRPDQVQSKLENGNLMHGVI